MDNSAGSEGAQLRALQERVAQLEADLGASRAENAALRQRFDAWIAMISHDLRGPLTLILGHAENLLARQSRDPAAARTRSGLEVIVGAAQRLNQMITQVVDGARLEAGTLALYPRELSLVVAFDDEARKWRRQHPGRGLRTQLPESLPTIQADPRRVNQIIAALLTNAAVFSPPGAPIRARAQAVGGAVVLALTDQGVGASPDEIQRIFEPAYRPERLRDQPRAGLGRNLANARRLAQAMGGDLWAESAGAGQGITFFLRLPIAPESPG